MGGVCIMARTVHDSFIDGARNRFGLRTSILLPRLEGEVLVKQSYKLILSSHVEIVFCREDATLSEG